MKAALIHENGPPEALKYEDIDPLPVGPNDAMIKVRATSVNWFDVMGRSGEYSAFKNFPHILGGDIAGEVVELVAHHWSAVGVKSTVKEVTPDEFRSAQSSNLLDVSMWRKGQPLAIVMGSNSLWVPPFDSYFFLRTGMLWAEWVDTKGAEGVEPPEYVKQLMSDINAFQSIPAGTPESDEIGARMVETMVSNTLFLGTVLAPGPIYNRNALKNVTEFKTHSYEYYWALPYRGPQWWLDE